MVGRKAHLRFAECARVESSEGGKQIRSLASVWSKSAVGWPIARVGTAKGVDTVIQALPSIAAKVPDVQYIIVGTGNDVERHKQLAFGLGVADSVHFLGSVDEAH